MIPMAIDISNMEDKKVQYNLKDIGQVITLLNNLNFKGIEQATAVVEMTHILNSGTIVEPKNNE